jgi:hypothetical protein
MDKLWKVLPLLVALAALGVVLLQRSTIQRLEGALAARSAPGRPARASPSTETGADAALERRVASLEQTVARVFRMVLAGQSRRQPGRGSGAAADNRSVADLREDVDALLTGEAVNTEKGRKQLHQIVRQVQEQVWQERRERWQTMRKEMQQARIKELAKKAGLSANQVERLGTLLDDERTRRRTLRRSVRDGQLPFAQVRGQMRALRQTTDQKAKEILDSRQYTEYEKMRKERRGPHRF